MKGRKLSKNRLSTIINGEKKMNIYLSKFSLTINLGALVYNKILVNKAKLRMLSGSTRTFITVHLIILNQASVTLNL